MKLLSLKITLEYKDLKGTIEGDYEKVWKFVNEFLGKIRNVLREVPIEEIYPINYELLQNIIEYGPYGPELVISTKVSQRNGILLALYSFGGREKAEKIFETVRSWGIHFKNKKVFQARVNDLKKEGLIGTENGDLVLKIKGKNLIENYLRKLKGE